MADEGRNEQGRWRPGQSGNPRGRPPRKCCLGDALDRRLNAEVALSSGAKTTVADALAARLITLALAGNLPALKLAFERHEGRPLQMVDFDTPGPLAVYLPLSPPPDESRSPLIEEAEPLSPAGDAGDPPAGGAGDEAQDGGAEAGEGGT